MDSTYFVIIAGAVAAGLVQGISGFAFSLVAMSAWAWVLEPRLAAALAVFGALLGQIFAAVTVRRMPDFKLLAPFVLGGLTGIPLGVLLLPHLDADVFRAMLGVVLTGWCSTMLLTRHFPRISGGRLGDGFAGLAGGLLGGLGGFTGVVPTLWCTLRGFSKDTQRGVIQNFNLAMLLVTMGTYLAMGIVTTELLPLFAIVIPPIFLSTALGARLYIGMSDARFRQVILGLLIMSGVAMLSSAIPNFLSH